jgi:hypothetical protein
MQNIVSKIAMLPDEPDKQKAIKVIHDYVNGNDEFLKLNYRIQDILSEFAHDLDFYEPNADLRREDPAYYDETRLKEEVEKVRGC